MVATAGILGTPFSIDWVVRNISAKLGLGGENELVLLGHQEKRIGEGLGFFSIVARINLQWAPNAPKDVPIVVVMKIPTTISIEKAMKKMMADSPEVGKSTLTALFNMIPVGHNNECAFYDIMSQESTAPLPLPKLYAHQTMSDVAQPGALLMDDFSARNGIIVNAADGLSLRQLERVMDSFGQFYAWSIEGQAKFIDKFDNDMMSKQHKGRKHTMTAVIANLVVKYPEFFTADDDLPWATTDEYIERISTGDGSPPLLFDMPTALVHGDMWTNNLLFKKVDTVDGKDVFCDDVFAVIDWQCAHEGNIVEDISHLLVSSCSKEIRETHTDALLERFYEKCCAKLSAQPTFTLADVKNAYEFTLPFSTIFTIFKIGVQLDNEECVGKVGTDVHARRTKSILARTKSAIAASKATKGLVEKVINAQQ